MTKIGTQVRAFLATVGTACAAIAALNFFVNPLGYYPVSLVPPLSASSRTQKASLMSVAPAPGVLIIGSSRTMKLAPEEILRLTGKRSFNASVDSAMTEDYYAMLRYALEDCGWRPSELVIGVDVEAFHNRTGIDSRLASEPRLRRYIPIAMRLSEYKRQAEQLLASDQVMQSLRALGFVLHGFPRSNIAFDTDGQLHYLEWERKLVEGRFVPDIESSLRSYQQRFAGYTELDSARKAFFERTLELAASHRMEIRAFITPLHRATLVKLQKTRDFDRLRGLVVGYLDAMAAQHAELSVVDYTEVAAFGGDPNQFFDGAHIRDENAVRLVRALFGTRQGATRAVQ